MSRSSRNVKKDSLHSSSHLAFFIGLKHQDARGTTRASCGLMSPGGPLTCKIVTTSQKITVRNLIDKPV
jgi:hypothetical protein